MNLYSVKDIPFTLYIHLQFNQPKQFTYVSQLFWLVQRNEGAKIQQVHA
jgi:hypothetical protein